MNPSFEEMYQACVQHYIDKGYSPEHSVSYIEPPTEDKLEDRVLWIFKWIQTEKLSQAINGNNI